MGIRRKSREAALQFLFQEDFQQQGGLRQEDLSERFESFCTLYQVEKKARPYAGALLAGVVERCEEIDGLISAAASNWRLSRIAATDRNILRLAVYEMVGGGEVPDQVIINEAVEISKRFAGDESPSFINGVLDAVRKTIRK